MVKSSVQLLLLFFVIVLFACSSANNKPLLIDFSADSSSVVFNQIDQTGLLQLKSLGQGDSTLNNLISVLQTPSAIDTGLRELPVDGKIMVTDSNLVFIPASPFVKGKTYLVVTYLNARFGSIEKILKNELKPGIRPQQKVLTR